PRSSRPDRPRAGSTCWHWWASVGYRWRCSPGNWRRGRWSRPSTHDWHRCGRPRMQRRDAVPGLRLAEAIVVVAALVTGRSRRRGLPGVDEADLRAGYELHDMQVGVVFSVLGALLVVLAVVLVLVTAFMARLTGIPPSISRPSDLIQGLTSPAEPT